MPLDRELDVLLRLDDDEPGSPLAVDANSVNVSATTSASMSALDDTRLPLAILMAVGSIYSC